MTTIVTRAGKGAQLSWEEADANFTNLNTDKLEAADLVASSVVNTPSGSISAITVQSAIDELDGDIQTKAPIASPTFINTVTSPRNYNVSGVIGALQVGGVDAVTFDSTGILTGIPPFPSLGMRMAQLVTTQVGTVATGTTIIPADNTIPQITEGDQYMSLNITPQDSASILEVEVDFFGTHSVAAASMTVALFRDSTANAIAVGTQTVPTGGYQSNVKFKWIGSAASLAATTFKVRAGGNAAGTTTFNGSLATQFYGGSLASRITIKEYLP